MVKKKRSVVKVVFWLLFSEEEGGRIFTQRCQVLVLKWEQQTKLQQHRATCHAQMLSKTNKQTNKQTTSKQIPTIAHKINSQLQDLAKFYKPRNSRNKPDPQMYKAKKKKKKKHHIERCWIAAPHKTRNKK